MAELRTSADGKIS